MTPKQQRPRNSTARNVILGGSMLAALSACSGDPKPNEKKTSTIARVGGSIELESLSNGVFDVAVANLNVSPPNDTAELARQLAALGTPSHASGAAHVPAIDTTTMSELRKASDGTTLRATCGVTFISPSFAITAVHCVPSVEVEPELVQIEVEMYRPSARVREHLQAAGELSGSFPAWSRQSLGAEHGYYTDRFGCEVAASCGTEFGNAPSHCEGIDQADIALLRCEGRPGLKYGYLNVAASEIAGAELLLPWAHELLDVSPNEEEHFGHYIGYEGFATIEEHFHYFGEQRNDLLPLLAVDWPDGTHHARSDFTVEVAPYAQYTDFLGCHGTSGSGVLQLNEQTQQWEVLGPVSRGNPELSSYLCNHLPSLSTQFDAIPTSGGLGYTRASFVRQLLQANASELNADCQEDSAHSVLRYRPWRTCSSVRSNRDWTTEWSEAPLAEPSPHTSLSAGSELLVAGLGTVAGTSYRLGLRALPAPDCSVLAPCTLTFSLGAGEERSIALTNGGPAVLGITLDHGEGGDQLALSSADAAFDLSELTLWRSGRSLAFDRFAERESVSLRALSGSDPVHPLPARFEGDEAQGFRALLRSQERLVLPNLGLNPGQWAMRYQSPSAVSLRCGLLSTGGDVLSIQDCAPGSTTPLGSLDASYQVLGVYIETTATQDGMQLDDIEFEYVGGLAGNEICHADEDCESGSCTANRLCCEVGRCCGNACPDGGTREDAGSGELPDAEAPITAPPDAGLAMPKSDAAPLGLQPEVDATALDQADAGAEPPQADDESALSPESGSSPEPGADTTTADAESNPVLADASPASPIDSGTISDLPRLEGTDVGCSCKVAATPAPGSHATVWLSALLLFASVRLRRPGSETAA